MIINLLTLLEGDPNEQIALATWVIAGATIVNLLVSALMWKITRQYAEASNRPYITTSNPSPMRNIQEKRLHINIQVNNNGNVTAHALKVSCSLFSNGTSITTIYPDQRELIIPPRESALLSMAINKPEDFTATTEGRVEFKMIVQYKGVTRKEYVYEQRTIYKDNTFKLIESKSN